MLLYQVGSKGNAETSVYIQGIENYPDLLNFVEKTVSEKYKDEGIDNGFAIRRDAVNAMKSMGYYDANVQTSREENVVILNANPATQYSIGSIKIEGYESPIDINIKDGDGLVARDVLTAQVAIRQAIAQDACYYSLSVRHEVILDEDRRTGDIKFIVNTSPPVTFGETFFEGAESIDRDYLEKFVKYDQGECWNAEKIEQTKTALLGTGLINLAQTDLPRIVTKDQAVDITFDLKERAPRSVRLGASYYTDEGAGFLASWTHRNLFGAAEELTARLKTTLILQELGLDFKKPYFLTDNQSLSISTAVKNEDSDAFEETNFTSNISLGRTFADYWIGDLGIGAEITKITDKNNANETNTFGLLSLPASLTFDNRDDPLDPHRGLYARARVTPFFDTFGEASPFVKTRLTASTYFDLSDSDTDPVLALRGSIGSILGTDTSNIPASKRFFAGGGNSVRGYGFQEVGPKENGDPTGGRSIIETSAEMRFKITDTIGAVAFVDGGNVYDAAMPDFSAGYYWGAGVGARYYTDFGPIRFDVGVPLNNRDDVDQAFQIYISIGQAF